MRAKVLYYHVHIHFIQSGTKLEVVPKAIKGFTNCVVFIQQEDLESGIQIKSTNGWSPKILFRIKGSQKQNVELCDSILTKFQSKANLSS